ncbi:MAG: gliding motility lipoprotein GldD [Cytophagales bacterium]|nr:gliding motility lipoprotein GldD [Cytophagales bacterium]MDW8383254.1 gliding motility lipoprotein GldD [Flammeovirgaceae bacterium]
MRFIFLLWGSFMVVGCSFEEETYLPKKRGYHRIELPAHEYQLFDSARVPFSFEYSKHSVIMPDRSFMTEPFWYEILYPKFSAQISIAYKHIVHPDTLPMYFNTSSKLTHKHHIKATAIEEYFTQTPFGYAAIIAELEGDVPSTFQWFVTDSSKHFLRAALYFPSNTRNDSLAPVIEFVKQDMMHLLNTVQWKTKKK